MCDVCVLFVTDRCPPVRERPEPDHAEHLAREQAIQALLAARDRLLVPLDAATKAILRGRLGRPEPR